MPVRDVRVPVVNLARNQGEPIAILTGVDPARLAPFGGLVGVDGEQIDLAAIAAGEVVISETMAETLVAAPGDQVMIFYGNLPTTLRVAAVAGDSAVSGEREVAISMVMPLARLQALTGEPDRLTGVAISNRGGVRDGVDGTEAVLAKLRPALQGQGLGVDDIKRDSVEKAIDAAALFTALFLVLGLFSIAAGILLIVLIFSMLAAERRSEMGMARAIGTHRRQLTAQYVAEGSGYALIAGLIGSGMGVLAAIGVAAAAQRLFGDYFTIEPHVTGRSLVVAFCLGVVITLATVVAASWRISRLNVVAAIRDLPGHRQPARPHARAGLGSGRACRRRAADARGRGRAGVALLCRHEPAPGRGGDGGGVLRHRRPAVGTAVGLSLLALWLLPQAVADRLFGELESGIEMFFVAGIFMVLGATIVIVQNTDVPARDRRPRGPALQVEAAGGADRGRLPRRRPRPDRDDDRDVQPDRLLPGDDGDDEPELRQPLPRRRGQRRLGRARRRGERKPDRRTSPPRSPRPASTRADSAGSASSPTRT